MELVKYDAAKKALAEAKQVDEVKSIYDKSTAIKAYAIQAKDKQLEIDASEIRIRAERRLGEMLREQKETVGLNTGTRGQFNGRDSSGGALWEPPEGNTPTLSDVGISKKLSSRSQAIAGIPENEFEDTLNIHREEQQAVTARTMETLAKKAHVANNSGENEWYTPKNIIESARQAMGSIDFDPASCELANETVKALQFCTKEDSGLDKEWSGNVWLNPPYAQPLIMQFCEKVAEQKGNYNQAIILVNNATETAWFRKLISVADAVCFTSGRVKFIDKNGNPTGAPLQGQAMIYIGENLRDFKDAFKETGWIAIIEE